MNPLNPSTWSAKAQALLSIVLGLVCEYLNARAGTGLPTGATTLGGIVHAAATAIIDHGEPAAPATANTLTDAEKATAKSLLPPAIAAKFGLVALLAFTLSVAAGCGTVNGLIGDVKAVAGSPDVKADVVALDGEIAKLRADIVAARLNEGPDVVALAGAITNRDYAGAVADLVTAAPQLAAAGDVILADGKAIHATLSKLATDAQSAIRLARAAAKLVPPQAAVKTPLDPSAPTNPPAGAPAGQPKPGGGL